MSDPTLNQLARELTALQEKMNTHQAEHRTEIGRLAKNMAERDARRTEHDAGMVKHEILMILAMTSSMQHAKIRDVAGSKHEQ